MGIHVVPQVLIVNCKSKLWTNCSFCVSCRCIQSHMRAVLACKIIPLCLGCRYPTFVHPKSSTKLLKSLLSSEPNLSIVGPTCSLVKTRSPKNNTLPSNTKIDLLVLQTLAQTPIHVKMYCYTIPVHNCGLKES